MSYSLNIVFVTFICHVCGIAYAIPEGFQNNPGRCCPNGHTRYGEDLRRKAEYAEEQRETALRESARLTRQNAALRGALKRAKGRG